MNDGEEIRAGFKELGLMLTGCFLIYFGYPVWGIVAIIYALL